MAERRVTTTLLMGHLPEVLARLAESYIIHRTPWPCDMVTAGHWELTTKIADDHLTSALYGACRGDSMAMVHYILSRGEHDYSFGLLGACCSANFEAAALMLSLGAAIDQHSAYFDAAARYGQSILFIEWMARRAELTTFDITDIMNGGASTGNMPMVNWAIGRGAGNWDIGLFSACEGGDRGIILLMLILGGNVNFGLRGACAGGEVRVARQMISRGAIDFDGGLRTAAKEGYIGLASLMITHGASDLDTAYEEAYCAHEWVMAKWLLDHGATTRVCKGSLAGTVAEHLIRIEAGLAAMGHEHDA